MAGYFQAFSKNFWGVSFALAWSAQAMGLKNKCLVFVRVLEPELSGLQGRYLWFGSAFAHERPTWIGRR